MSNTEQLAQINSSLQEIKGLLQELIRQGKSPLSPHIGPTRPHWYGGVLRKEEDLKDWEKQSYNDAGIGMTICPECGNKRCPRASSPMYVCTMSNEPNQTPRLRKS